VNIRSSLAKPETQEASLAIEQRGRLGTSYAPPCIRDDHLNRSPFSALPCYSITISIRRALTQLHLSVTPLLCLDRRQYRQCDGWSSSPADNYAVQFAIASKRNRLPTAFQGTRDKKLGGCCCRDPMFRLAFGAPRSALLGDQTTSHFQLSVQVVSGCSWSVRACRRDLGTQRKRGEVENGSFSSRDLAVGFCFRPCLVIKLSTMVKSILSRILSFSGSSIVHQGNQADPTSRQYTSSVSESVLRYPELLSRIPRVVEVVNKRESVSCPSMCRPRLPAVLTSYPYLPGSIIET
jgi:hypothetical protein